ncbi:MAG TPA: hypothetical protein D7H99_04365 [Candidatus Poseidoniales archaeon]|nr:MAG TPA: hypothetical protein D7H99_04365 [Candidatus Poseidoniales archaeon]HII58175.1 hypothetical protein [Candidatus Poseidoniaceae archaeon]|tara:strand:- start:448 stop:1026 length:579 start_codon:yes stop_codon:yes gene_type:complete
MISSATFHVITTELVVGSFAMAGICFLVLAIQSFGLFESEKASLISDNAGHFALGFGLLATPFAIFSGISSSPTSDLSSPLLVNKMFLSMIATGLALAVLFTRYKMGNKLWNSKSNSRIQSAAGLAASGFMLMTASAGGKFSRGESVLDFLNLPYDTIFLMPTWASGIILLAGVGSAIIAVMNLSKSSTIEH